MFLRSHPAFVWESLLGLVACKSLFAGTNSIPPYFHFVLALTAAR